MRLTYPELEYLLSDDERWPAVRSSLGLSGSADSETLKAAGLVSLFARELAHVAQGEVFVSDRANEVAKSLVSSSDAFAVTRLDDEQALSVGVLLIDASDGSRNLASLVAPGVLDVAALRRDGSVPDDLARLTIGLLHEKAGSVGLMRAKASGNRSIVIARTGDAWTIQVADGVAVPTTPEGIVGAIKDLLAQS